MKKIKFTTLILLIFNISLFSQTLEIQTKNNIDKISVKDTIEGNIHIDTLILNDSLNVKLNNEELITKKDSIFVQMEKNMRDLNQSSPMEFILNEITYSYIEKYINKKNKLIPKMISLSEYYFPMIEQELDRFQIPLELKYIAIVESSLNPTAVSRSGARGLWQFMYPTAKQYELKITSYIDERQDPLKSTIAACEYFSDLYKIFNDWNLVLAAYNAGPGYLDRIIKKKGFKDYWQLRPYLRKETQGYIPSFIAISYAMTHYKNYNIEPLVLQMDIDDTDTISFKEQVSYQAITDFFCVPLETIIYLNPSFKRDIVDKNEVICLPDETIKDVVKNEDYFYQYLLKVEKKEILVNEKREVYFVVKGDNLSKIAHQYNIKVSEIIEWNSLETDFLSIGDKLILYLPDNEK